MIKMTVKSDMGELERLKKEMTETIDAQIYDIADQIFAVSQGMVPVDRGTLKKSGNVRYGRGYAWIGYNTPYAEDIHDGHPEHDRVVRSHERICHSGVVVTVRTHIRHMHESTGRPYLDNAIKQVLSQLPREVRDSITITRLEREY